MRPRLCRGGLRSFALRYGNRPVEGRRIRQPGPEVDELVQGLTIVTSGTMNWSIGWGAVS
jgi:hypothetical protein